MMNFKIYAMSVFAIIAFLGCSDSSNDNGEVEGGKPAATEVQFAAGAQLKVLIGEGAPTPEAVTGTITNADGLASYTAYYTHQGGTRMQIGDKIDLAGADIYNFTITSVPYPANAAVNETGVILLKVVSAHGDVENAQLPVLFSAYEDGDTEYDYEKLPDNLNITKAMAFPTADGYGKYATGGRGGKVLIVNSLADDGSTGTLRWAVNQSGKRIVVFQVGGTIKLTSSLTIKNGDLTIAGQTAPGDGICLTGNSLIVDASNVIIRYIRSRPASYSSTTGDVETDGLDAAWGRLKSNVIIDHCSFTWSTDEAASFYGMENFTMQYCIVGESLYTSSHTKGSHGYGGIWGGNPATFHHNLIISNDSRNPRFDGNRKGTSFTGRDLVDFINNVIFNWGSNNVYGGEGSDYNMVNNYYKPGPATKSSVRNRIMEIYDPNRAAEDGAINPEEGKYYFSGNYMVGNESMTADNLIGVVDNRSYGVEKLIATSPIAAYSIEMESAEAAYVNVLAHVGASLVYDAVDTRLIEFAKTGVATWGDTYGANTGIIDDAAHVGGLPALASGTVTDADTDGMADAWELLNGLDPNKNDANANTLNEYYTNIEMFANSFVDFRLK
ncbi:MAG: polysaccharide lyase family 1 protein [Mangrovibacterium sp.]